MGFWKNVDEYLKFKGIPRKELAIGTGIKVQTIDRAIQRDSDAKFAEGLKVCKYLNVPFEEFLGSEAVLPNDRKTDSQKEIKEQLNLYRKYHELIRYCEFLPSNQRQSVIQLAKSLAEAIPSYTPSH